MCTYHARAYLTVHASTPLTRQCPICPLSRSHLCSQFNSSLSLSLINIAPIIIFSQASCKRFVSQLLNLALRAAKKYDERETVTWMNQIAKYTVFISSAVDADGNLFKEVSDTLVTHYIQPSHILRYFCS